MSKYKITKVRPVKEEKNEPLAVFLGKILVGCGAIFVLLGIFISIIVAKYSFFRKADIIGIVVMTLIGVVVIAIGAVMIIKKPGIKIDGYTAKAMVNDLEREADMKLSAEEKKELIDSIKGTKI